MAFDFDVFWCLYICYSNIVCIILVDIILIFNYISVFTKIAWCFKVSSLSGEFIPGTPQTSSLQNNAYLATLRVVIFSVNLNVFIFVCLV